MLVVQVLEKVLEKVVEVVSLGDEEVSEGCYFESIGREFRN